MVTSEQLAELHATIQRLQEEKVKLGIQADAKIQRLSDEKEALQNTCTKMQGTLEKYTNIKIGMRS